MRLLSVFSDAGEVVETTTHRMNELPLQLNEALLRRGISASVRYAFQHVEDCWLRSCYTRVLTKSGT